MLNPTQVDLSIIFPKLNAADGNPTNPMPEFLSGEKRQAVRTSTLIPPAKKVKRINEECNRTQLQNYLYVSSYSYKATKLTLSRSKYSIDLSQDLDDAAVSILVQNGLDNKFPAACGAWKSRNAESKETARKSIIEEKQRVDRKLADDRPLLEDTLAGELAKRILDAYPYVFHSSAENKRLTYSQSS